MFFDSILFKINKCLKYNLRSCYALNFALKSRDFFFLLWNLRRIIESLRIIHHWDCSVCKTLYSYLLHQLWFNLRICKRLSRSTPSLYKVGSCNYLIVSLLRSLYFVISLPCRNFFVILYKVTNHTLKYEYITKVQKSS